MQKTQSLLREALVSLIHEKPYDTIAVREILDRANVGRSTFYTHFRDKDELLVSGIHGMLGSVHSTRLPAAANRHERIIWFSLPVFEYHKHRRRGEAKMGTRGRAIIHEHLQRVLAELIADDVGKVLQGRRKTAGCSGRWFCRRWLRCARERGSIGTTLIAALADRLRAPA